MLLRVLLSVVLRGGPNVGGGRQYLALMERGIVLRVCGEPCGEHCPIIKQTSLQSLRRLRSRRCPSCLARLASAQGRPLPRQLNGPNRPAILQGRLPRPLAQQFRGWLRRKQSSRRQGGTLLTPRHLRPSRWLRCCQLFWWAYGRRAAKASGPLGGSPSRSLCGGSGQGRRCLAVTCNLAIFKPRSICWRRSTWLAPTPVNQYCFETVHTDLLQHFLVGGLFNYVFQQAC